VPTFDGDHWTVPYVGRLIRLSDARGERIFEIFSRREPEKIHNVNEFFTP